MKESYIHPYLQIFAFIILLGWYNYNVGRYRKRRLEERITQDDSTASYAREGKFYTNPISTLYKLFCSKCYFKTAFLNITSSGILKAVND